MTFSGIRSLLHRCLSPGLLALFLVGLMTLAAPFPVAAEPRTVRVGMTDFPPLWSYQQGRAGGVFAEILEHVARQEGWQLEYVAGTWEESIDRLRTGKIDLLGGMSYSEGRAREFDFSRETAFLDWGLVFRRHGEELKTIFDLRGKAVSARRGDLITTEFLKLTRQFQIDVRLVERDGYREVFQDVTEGRAEAGLSSHVNFTVLKHSYVVEPTVVLFAPVERRFAATKGIHTELLAAIDRHLTALKQDPGSFYHRSLESLLAAGDHSHPLPPWVVWTGLGLAAAILALLGFGLLLRRLVLRRTAELARTNAELEQFSAQYRAILRTTADGFALIDETGRLLDVNDTYCVYSGYTREALLGMSLGDLDVLATPTRTLQHIRELKEAGFSRFETRHRRKDGSRFDVEASITFAADANRLIVFLRDIASRKRAERALMESESRFRSLVENTDDLITRVDPEGRFLYVNHTAQRLFGLTPAECVGRLAFDFVHPEDREATAAAFREWLAGDQDRLSYENRVIDPAGQVHHLLWTITLLRDEAGRIREFSSIARDISARKQAERVIQARARLLQYALSHTVEELLQQTVDEVEQLTGSSIGFYHLLHGDQQAISLQAWSTRTLAEFCRAGQGAGHNDLATAGVWVDCIHQRRPVIHNDYPALKQRKGLPSGHVPIQRELAVPISRGEKIVAVLGVGNKSGNYDARDVETAALLADLSWSIVEHKQMQDLLSEGEERYRRLVDLSPDAIFLHVAGRFVFANTQGARLLGAERPDDLYGRPVIEFVHPDFRQQVQERLKDLDKQGKRVPMIEEQFLRLDGSVVNVEVTAIPFNYQGQPAVQVVARDIDARKAAEAALREREFWLRESQRAGKVGSYKLDMARGRWTSTSVLDEIFGIPADYDRTVEGWLAIVVPDHRQDMRDYFQRLAADRERDFDREYRIRRISDGKERWVHGRGEFILNDAGEPTAMIGTISDITDRRLLEDQLRQAQKMEAVGQLAGGIAHDFNNMLQVIVSYTGLLESRVGAGKPREFVAQILETALRASELTQGLLAYSRKQDFHLAPLDLNHILGDVRKLLLRILGEDIELVMEFADEPPVAILDPNQMQQVFINLAVNARDAMPEGGRLTIRTDLVEFGPTLEPPQASGLTGKYVRITVRDTGMGMDPAIREKIFEPFFTTKEVGKGTGLGLSIVYGIVTQHQGVIDCSSQPGEGSLFSIYLPAGRPDTAVALSKGPVGKVLVGSGTILVAEDDDQVRTSSKLVLSAHGYRVIEARDGEEALALYRENREAIDLVLLDVVMPKKNGREVLAEIRNLNPAARVCFVSGYAHDVLKDQADGADEVTVIEKPIPPARLLAKIRILLDQ